MPLRARVSSQRGFTLIETMVAALILLIGISGMVLLYTTAAKTTLKNRQREGGLALSRDVLESARAIPYQDLTPAQIIPKLQAQSGLADSSGASGYTVTRRGTTYNVDATVCSYDDPSDLDVFRAALITTIWKMNRGMAIDTGVWSELDEAA